MAGIVTTGECVLIDRLPYGETEKTPPVDPAILRNHIQLTHTLDDNLVLGVGGYMMAATTFVENMGHIALITQKRRQYIGEEYLDDLAGNTFALGYGPSQSLLAVQYLDEDGNEETMPAANYRFARNAIYFSGTLPPLADGPDTVWVDYVAGYGSSYTSIPADWQNIVAMVASHMYDLRGDVGKMEREWHRFISNMIVTAGGSKRGY